MPNEEERQTGYSVIVETALRLATWKCGVKGCKGKLITTWIGEYFNCHCDVCCTIYSLNIQFIIEQQPELPQGEILARG